MKPPKREFERINTNEFVNGRIVDVQYEAEHEFNFQGNKKKSPAVRFKFEIEGYQHYHYSRWMTFMYGEKTNLYLKYLVPLVEGAQPDMDFDIENLKGMKVKMLWQERNGFQYVETIRPQQMKLRYRPIAEHLQEDELKPDEEVPF